MRLAILTTHASHIGGAETYVERQVAGLRLRGHEVFVLFEGSPEAGRRALCLPEGVKSVIAEDGWAGSLAELRKWQPDLLLVHGLSGWALEAKALEVAPAVAFAHSYVGACISGVRAHKAPRWVPCERVFGTACLLHYFPRRCGGLDPRTMVRSFKDQRERRRLLDHYVAVVVHSEHMRQEYVRQGLSEHQVRLIHYPVWPDGQEVRTVQEPGLIDRSVTRLLFLGRMEESKGGRYLLEALAILAKRQSGKVSVEFGGDGSARASWERSARHLARTEALDLHFLGWLNEHQRRDALRRADALVVPSLWPEPFGLVGPEAGLEGTPAIAFDVGGVRDWLSDGVNGFLAPGRPPTPMGLAAAIQRFREARPRAAELRANALQMALRFSPRSHFDALNQLLRATSLQTHP
jgi:glycosyltransferase involved in cell wall biosynthesis